MTAASIDGTTIEPSIAVQMRLGPWLLLAAGYALTWMIPVTTDSSTFDPQAAATCAQAGGALDNPACAARNEGRALPTSAGHYQQLGHVGSLAVTATF